MIDNNRLIKNSSLKKSSLSFFLGEILFIMYTKIVHGAPTKPIKSFSSLLILFDVILIAL